MEKELESESLTLFEKENENIEKTETIKVKNTLFTILNGERADLEIEEIFDSNRFYEIKAVTFSADENFLNKYLTPFKSVDLVIGIQDVDVQVRGLKALENETKNLIESQKAIIKKKQIRFFENLSRENQESIVEEKWKLRVPISSTIHSKFYLLKNDSETRLIFGSANLSFQAFSNKRNQFENIVIFDNSPLFNQFEEYFNEITLTCTDFITKAIRKKAKSKIKVLDENNDEKQEETFSVRFTQDESAKLQIDVSKDVVKEFNDVIVKEEDSVALPIIEEIKTIDEKQKIIENEKKEELEVEKFAYELSINTISRQAKKKESMVVTPETQIQLWMNENNVAPILIDEIDEEFFSNKDRGNNLIVNVSNLSTSNFDFTPCFIGTTNALEYSLPQRAQRRSYYVKNDKVFDTELKKKSVKAYTEVFEIINDTLFQDFVIRFAEKLTDDNLSWKNYSLHSSTGLIDFLYWSREIFKEYFEIAQIEIPAWFPETRYDDTVENNQSLWRKLYEYNHQDFKVQKEKGVYLFKLKSLDSEEGQSNRFGTKILPSTKYLNALSQKCKNDNNSSDIIEIKIKEFHDWIGVPLPKGLKHKKTILDFFKKKKSEK